MNKKSYIDHFKNKKITVMGLGLLGRGLQVTEFLASCGAKITVTDLKSRKDLRTSISVLKKYKLRYVLGRHDISDFENVDMVVKSAGVPLDSPYIKHALKLNIPVVMDASLFAKLVKAISPKVTIIGITGTRGKSMTTAITYHLLKQNERTLGAKVYLGGNMRMKATLPLIKSVKPGDYVVLELDSWQCQGFGDEKISPHISVFTNLMPDHMNYYNNDMRKYLSDKSNIFKFQTKKDLLIVDKHTLEILKEKINGRIILSSTKSVEKIPLHIIGNHNLKNASYAYNIALSCKLPKSNIINSLETFRGLEGRLQYLRKIKGVHVINDNNSTTPEATTVGIEAVQTKYNESNIILVAGGSDKKLNTLNLIKTIEKYCSKTILLPGTGTDVIKKDLKINCTETTTLKKAIEEALRQAKRDDVILFSPGFASFGLFKNEYDRNDQFVDIIKKWK